MSKHRALLHKYLKLLRGKDCQLKALIDQTLYNKAFRRKAESLCNNAETSPSRITTDDDNRRPVSTFYARVYGLSATLYLYDVVGLCGSHAAK
jgi:hypothetical protein